MLPNSSLENNVRRRLRFAGTVLIVEALMSIATMLFHPEVTQSTAMGAIAQIVDHSTSARWVHGLMMVFIVLNYFAISEYAELLRRRGASPNLGLVFYIFGAMAFLLAATISGFMMTTLAERYSELSISAQESFLHTGRALGAANQAFAKSGTIAYGVTAFAWGVVLVRYRGFARIVGVAGVVAGAPVALGILLGMRLDVLGMTAVTVMLAAWYVSIAIDLLKASQENGQQKALRTTAPAR